MQLTPSFLHSFTLFTSTLTLGHPTRRSQSTSTTITPSQISQFSPSCSSSASSSPDANCKTPTQVAPLMNQIFSDYKVGTIGEQAALLSLMSYESENFLFNKNT